MRTTRPRRPDSLRHGPLLPEGPEGGQRSMQRQGPQPAATRPDRAGKAEPSFVGRRPRIEELRGMEEKGDHLDEVIEDARVAVADAKRASSMRSPGATGDDAEEQCLTPRVENGSRCRGTPDERRVPTSVPGLAWFSALDSRASDRPVGEAPNALTVPQRSTLVALAHPRLQRCRCRKCHPTLFNAKSMRLTRVAGLRLPAVFVPEAARECRSCHALDNSRVCLRSDRCSRGRRWPARGRQGPRGCGR